MTPFEDQKSEVKVMEKENCIVEKLLPEDVMYHILLWLPVISLLRFNFVCKSWCALIECSDFIKEHLHHHHYNCTSFKDKNHSLIFWLPTKYPPTTYLLTSVNNFEVPADCLQLDCFDLHEHFHLGMRGISSFNGIVCLTMYGFRIEKYCIYLWNPARKQSRLLPELSFPHATEVEGSVKLLSVGFGFDVKTNDYKVVKLIIDDSKKRVEVYNLSTDSWRSIDSIYPGHHDQYLLNPQMPFHNGTCFCWMGSVIFSFDFGSERFRTISFPNDHHQYNTNLCIVDDKIACVSSVNFPRIYTEIWVFSEHGSANGSWAKLYKIDPYSAEGFRSFSCLLMSENYLFLGTIGWVCRYNVVTKEVKYFSSLELEENFKDHSYNTYNFNPQRVAQYKDSLVSV